jgi:hypothetical protein
VTVATSRQQASILQAERKDKKRGESDLVDVVLRAFEGVNLQSPREAINDDQFYWLEELIPIGPGNLTVCPGPVVSPINTVAETGAPSYSITFNLAGVDYQFVVWSNSGNAWVGPQNSSSGWTKIATGLYTSGQTAATQWNNLGLVIVDPAVGMRDWNITTANTLTNLSGQVYNPVLESPLPSNVASFGALTVVDTGAGSGATVGMSLSAVSVSITAAGTGYLAGDVLTAQGGTLTTSSAAPSTQQSQPLVITVTAINVSTGAITGISITNPGYYQVAPSSANSMTGGAGSTATFTFNFTYSSPFMITPGTGYVAPSLKIAGVASKVITFSTSGTTLGTAVAAYAGRIWIAIQRTIQYTDVNSYTSFGGAGGSFTINDAYLHNNITALAAGNNYLYIWGDDSLDILSNVAVASGVTSFSRINVSASVGCTRPQSIFPWIRSMAFAASDGFYLVSGATPEKISSDLDGLFNAIGTTAIYGAQVMVDKIRCAGFLVQFLDSFTTTTPTSRSIICLYFNGKWWFTSQMIGGVSLNTFTSNPVLGVSTGFAWVGNSFYKLLSSPNNTNNWLLKTKLWDVGEPMVDKQAIKAAIGCVTTTGVDISVYVDTEYTSFLTSIGLTIAFVEWINNLLQPISWVNSLGQVIQWASGSSSNYSLYPGTANAGGGKFMGITASGASNVLQIRLLALGVENTRPW